MKNRNLLWTGIVGFVISMVCCFTPLLVVLFGAVGLSVWLGWVDIVLFPAMAGFMALTVYAYARQRRGGVAARGSTVTCPECGHREREHMPEGACVVRYSCVSCGTLMRPAAGDCCIFCTYGSVPCPPIQAAGT